MARRFQRITKHIETGTRVTYLQGKLELMSRSINHELLKKMLARLLEAYAEN